MSPNTFVPGAFNPNVHTHAPVGRTSSMVSMQSMEGRVGTSHVSHNETRMSSGLVPFQQSNVANVMLQSDNHSSARKTNRSIHRSADLQLPDPNFLC
jgi:hypothetical protein